MQIYNVPWVQGSQNTGNRKKNPTTLQILLDFFNMEYKKTIFSKLKEIKRSVDEYGIRQ